MYRSSISPYEEERLVARCLRGEDTAWEMMFHLYHPQLVSIITGFMHGKGAMEQAEEIAAAVWSSLCSEAYTRLAVRPAGRPVAGLPREHGPERNPQGEALEAEPLFSRKHGRSQGGNLGRGRRRARHSGIPGHPDPPGTRVLHVRSHETIKDYGPIGGLLGQRMAAPQSGPEKVPDVLPPG
jgi:hypothetical protein